MRGFRSIRTQGGQGMTEYILIVALIAIFVIGAVKLFGKKTKEGFHDAARTMDANIQKGISDSSKEK